MKLARFFIVSGLLTLSGQTFAQIDVDVDVDDINQRSDEAFNRESAQRNSERRLRAQERMKKVEQYFKNSFSFTEAAIPKDRSFSASEEMKKEIIGCVEKILDKHKGGYDAPSIAQKVLLTSFTKDEADLEETKNECWKVYNSLYNFADRKTDSQYLAAARALPVLTPEEQNSRKLVLALMNDGDNICRLTSAQVSAGLVVLLGAGVNSLRCMFPNGKIRTYIAPSFVFRAGYGGAITIDREDPYAVSAGSVGAAFASERTDSDGGTIIGLGRLDSSLNSKKGFALGLEFAVLEENFGVGVRVINGKRRWVHLVELLE